MSRFPLEKDGPTKNEKKGINFGLFLEFLFFYFKASATKKIEEKEKKGDKKHVDLFLEFFGGLILLQKCVKYF